MRNIPKFIRKNIVTRVISSTLRRTVEGTGTVGTLPRLQIDERTGEPIARSAGPALVAYPRSMVNLEITFKAICQVLLMGSGAD